MPENVTVLSVISEREAIGAPVSHIASELTMVVPTLNERDNIVPLVKLIEAALSSVAWEVIFVDDDSPDGTVDMVRKLAQHDSRVRCLQRIGRRGLSTACIEGMLASASPYVAVMDADLQHDERLLPQMLETLRNEPYDLVVGSRYVAGGGVGEWDRSRANISSLATRLSRLICKTDISDPMSGFFMVRREVFEGATRNLSGLGFKILLDLIASSPQPVRLKELPFQFRQRQHGESKLDTLVAWEFGMLLADKLIGHIVPIHFAFFAFVGALGLIVHFCVLWTSLQALGFSFVTSQTLATILATTFNFFLNNLFTYRDQRFKGTRIIGGLLSFYLICSVGAFANVGIAYYLFTAEKVWWLAGISGALVSSVWNYATSSLFTWRRR
jgi:dolichol-phosphate mannosyltransferase